MHNPDDTVKASREAALEKRVAQTIAHQNLLEQQNQIQSISQRLNISLLECAAALLYLNQPKSNQQAKPAVASGIPLLKPGYRSVRYRLDVGKQHNVAREQIEAVLIAESGVDKKRIGKIDIRAGYTLVELPDGMPADIFQLLSEAVVCDRRLDIKRVKSNRRMGKVRGE